jgi:hypothetical protein
MLARVAALRLCGTHTARNAIETLQEIQLAAF